MRTNEPVPYVFFAIPSVKHAWPKRADCWSPAAPEIGIDGPSMSGAVSPKRPLDGFTSGSKERGIESRSRIQSSQSASRSEYIIVRDALEGSVTWTPPPVSLYTSHESI